MPASVLAFVSSLHVGLVLLRYHRSAGHRAALALTCISSLFVAQPWLAGSLMPVVLGLAAHTAWFGLAAYIGRRPSADRPTARPASLSRQPGASSSQPGVATARAPRSIGFTPLTVVGIVDETPDIRTIRVSRPEGFDFAAGQFLTVRVRIDQRDHARCYSISSSPETPGYLEISVKRQGLVSAALHATLRPGSVLHARPPAGTFVYPERDDRALVLIAGGVGITPMISMLRHALATEPQRPVTLVQAARRADGLAFADELRVLERRWSSLNWIPVVSGADAPAWCCPGRIDAQLIRTAAPHVADSLVFMCGPASLIEGMESTLAALGVPKPQVRFERFEAAIAAVGAQTATESGPTAPDTGNVITFTQSGVAHTARRDESLLDAADACGASIPSLCRAGVCGTCRTRVKEGHVRCESSALGDDDRADGYVLACVAHSQSHCKVEA